MVVNSVVQCVCVVRPTFFTCDEEDTLEDEQGKGVSNRIVYSSDGTLE